MSTTTTQSQTKGFALLIKAPGATRSFTPKQGETITILDKDGIEVWSLKLPAPINNPGIILQEVQIDLLTERAFANFCQKTWDRGRTDQPGTPAPPPTSPT